MRAKWSAPIRKYWKISEQMMVKYCDLAICDSVNKENPNNESFIKQHISQELKIETFDITLDCLGQRIHEKFSESTHEEKVYSHRFYLAKISKFPDMMLQDSFECDGKQYYWMTVPELEQDENVQKKNNDILGYVKELV